MRERALEELAEKLGQTVAWLKSKLKALRNSYVKAKKPSASGSARKNPTKRSTWLLEKLQFLAPHVAFRASVSNLDTVSCTTPTSDLSTVELDDSIEDDNFSIENESWENNDTDTIEIVKSTKEPLKSRQINTQKRQADHEYSLIKIFLIQFLKETRNPNLMKLQNNMMHLENMYLKHYQIWTVQHVIWPNIK
ncbi:uncharacterized protein LOC124449639 [Xenia sp. Carnegie-2017]|uniref:uncharacterized protein LOC124449639 n=1 Tax=Xenia sp. Carnegie-2017 TaxID=2897299 RepID=UPI001F0386FD|nr:uncharacterized protein LOC124449639 [Xenia sp. Carnegie-2017]